jgi:uncharacterized protein involved in exopolysaccharide biosynthesis
MSGVTRYVEAFFRHKLLLITPVVLAMVVSVWYVRSQTPSYQASTIVWVDTSLPSPSSIDVTSQGTPPAQQAQVVLQELLGTRQFLIKVGHRGSLATYLASHTPAKHGPTAVLSRLLSGVKGHGGSAAPIDDRIAATLARAFTVSTTGPQALQVTMTSWAGGAIPDTLRAVVAEYSDEVTSIRSTRDQASLTYDEAQVATAKHALDTATSAVLDYQESHPGATVVSDPEFAQLEQFALTDQNNYLERQNEYSQATLALGNAASPGSIKTLDAPQGVSVISHKKKAIFGGVAGIVFGLLVSILAATALVATDNTAWIHEDLEDVEGLEVVASLEHITDSRRFKRLHEDSATIRTS